MLFTIQQIQEITGIIDFHSSYLIFQVLGKDSLSEFDKYTLEQSGIDVGKLVEKFPPYWQGYMFGRLTGQLNNYQSGQIDYSDFLKYIKTGQYFPLTRREKEEYEIAKQKSYGHIKGLGDRIKNNVNDIITEESIKRRQEYEKVIKDEIQRGVVERKSIQSVISEIGHKTGEWNRDWGRIVDTEMQSIFNKGRSEQIRKDKGDDALVYKETYPGACRWCIKLHLTNGIGSQPRLFTIPQLESNGDNIGKKVNDWKPTVYVVHPFCRCHLTYLPKGYVWDEEKKSFDVPKEYKQKIERVSKVEMKVGDKTFYI
jgi:hypothetical protein